MICSKGQLVRLTATTRATPWYNPPETIVDHPTATVMGFVYDRQPGERGVRLDRELRGSKWWVEDDLEAAD